MACHPSLKAGDRLTHEEAETLLDRLGECEQPFACPHGRPTVCSLDESTLAAGFERGRRGSAESGTNIADYVHDLQSGQTNTPSSTHCVSVLSPH